MPSKFPNWMTIYLSHHQVDCFQWASVSGVHTCTQPNGMAVCFHTVIMLTGCWRSRDIDGDREREGWRAGDLSERERERESECNGDGDRKIDLEWCWWRTRQSLGVHAPCWSPNRPVFMGPSCRLLSLQQGRIRSIWIEGHMLSNQCSLYWTFWDNGLPLRQKAWPSSFDWFYLVCFLPRALVIISWLAPASFLSARLTTGGDINMTPSVQNK